MSFYYLHSSPPASLSSSIIVVIEKNNLSTHKNCCLCVHMFESSFLSSPHFSSQEAINFYVLKSPSNQVNSHKCPLPPILACTCVQTCIRRLIYTEMNFALDYCLRPFLCTRRNCHKIRVLFIVQDRGGLFHMSVNLFPCDIVIIAISFFLLLQLTKRKS